VESEPGKGSTFHFTTRFRPAATPSRTAEKAPEKDLSGVTVLVVDDNSPNRNILAEMLTNWRMKATLAESGAHALELLEAAQRAGQPFSLVLLDSQMPGVDGFHVAQRIHDNPRLAGSVILMLSADRHLLDSTRCRDLGVKWFLAKPIGQSELLDTILMALGIRVAQERLLEIAEPVQESPKGRTHKILLTEDNPVNQKLAIRLLEKAGHRVTVANNGREAVRAWENMGSPGYELILMDIQMPEMDGLEATAAIREREKSIGKHIPIIAMTANAMRGDKERYMAGGMDGYVSKPILPRSLHAEIERCLDPIAKGIPVTTEITTSGELFDRSMLLERVEGDHELLNELIQLYFEDAPGLLAAMRGALERGNMPDLERSAHSMKGAAGNLCAQSTSAAAAQLEHNAKAGDLAGAKESLESLEIIAERLARALAVGVLK
jgi:CheY-like chemotaxis protein